MYDNIEFVIACAGGSTRNFPHSKGIAHKCLMPFGDKRLIDLVLKQITEIGGRHITLVCSNQQTIDAFKNALKEDKVTEEKLRKNGRTQIADALQETFLPADIDLKFVIQEKPFGNCVVGLTQRVSAGRHAVLIFPDDIIISIEKGKFFLKELVDSFLKDTKQIVCTGVLKEDVSNNAILVDNRLIEKPKNANTNIGVYSPIIFPTECVDFIEQQTAEMERTGQMPANLKLGEWVYVDGINAFLDAGAEKQGFHLELFIKPDWALLFDTGALPLYEQSLLFALLVDSRFKETNREYALRLLTGELLGNI